MIIKTASPAWHYLWPHFLPSVIIDYCYRKTRRVNMLWLKTKFLHLTAISIKFSHCSFILFFYPHLAKFTLFSNNMPVNITELLEQSESLICWLWRLWWKITTVMLSTFVGRSIFIFFSPFYDINGRAKSLTLMQLWRLIAQYEPFFNSVHTDLQGWPKETMMYCVWGEEILSQHTTSPCLVCYLATRQQTEALLNSVKILW